MDGSTIEVHFSPGYWFQSPVYSINVYSHVSHADAQPLMDGMVVP